jgi:hypothetical protein
MAKFRRNADAAKESIREFLGGWRGQQTVAAEVPRVHVPSILASVGISVQLCCLSSMRDNL